MCKDLDCPKTPKVRQDVHVHTTFSRLDGAIVSEQTVDLVASVRYAEIGGISDHIEDVVADGFEVYAHAVRSRDFLLGIEVAKADWTARALELDVDYYVCHCFDEPVYYQRLEKFLASGKPTIVAHPMATGANLSKVPPGCLIEINNRYVWQNDWRAYFTPYTSEFRFVLSSDAHQPHWLNQNIARFVANELGIAETIVCQGV